MSDQNAAMRTLCQDRIAEDPGQNEDRHRVYSFNDLLKIAGEIDDYYQSGVADSLRYRRVRRVVGLIQK